MLDIGVAGCFDNNNATTGWTPTHQCKNLIEFRNERGTGDPTVDLVPVPDNRFLIWKIDLKFTDGVSLTVFGYHRLVGERANPIPLRRNDMV